MTILIDKVKILNTSSNYYDAKKFKIDLSVLKEHAKYSSKEPIKDLACVVTHKRMEFISKWLKAWNNANKFGVKLAVLHAVDGDTPTEEEKDNILFHNPDFYIPVVNTNLRDLGLLISVCRGFTELPEWQNLYWFTDDMLPMRKNFLQPFIEKINKPNVGLVAQCYEPKTIDGAGAHIRTVAYATKKKIIDRLIFPYDAHEFEHGSNNILKQVQNMGYDFELCHSSPDSDNYQHWTSFLDWMWDCHLLGKWKEYWDIYEEQFKETQRFENVKTSTETLISKGQCEEYTSLPNKICVIIPTSTAPINCLLWSVFSLLLRSDRGIIENIIVGINGPDKRTGDPTLQDVKQKFLEELRDMKWEGKDMPLTVSRVWSRIGHGQTLEQCLPWVHTEYYISMHDDAIVLSKDWQKEAIEFFDKKDHAAQTYDNPIYGSLSEGQKVGPKNPDSLGFPHFNTVFTLCRKSLMKEIGASWIGYHIPLNFRIGNFANYNKFIEFHKKHGSLDQNTPPREDTDFKLISMDIGTFVFSNIAKNGYKISKFSKNIIKHFIAGSWGHGDTIVSKNHTDVDLLEEELKSYPEFWNLYKKYKIQA